MAMPTTTHPTAIPAIAPVEISGPCSVDAPVAAVPALVVLGGYETVGTPVADADGMLAVRIMLLKVLPYGLT